MIVIYIPRCKIRVKYPEDLEFETSGNDDDDYYDDRRQGCEIVKSIIGTLENRNKDFFTKYIRVRMTFTAHYHLMISEKWNRSDAHSKRSNPMAQRVSRRSPRSEIREYDSDYHRITE